MISKSDTLKRALVWIPAKLYELAVRLKIAAYETNYLRPKRLRAAVISVGNVTLGGTGKTPIVEYLARYLASEGRSVAILTRGYRRSTRGQQVLNAPGATQQAMTDRVADADAHLNYGDEPVMLARMLPEVPIVIDADRFEAGRRAEEMGADVVILDDGYQHLRLSRDLNLLLLDATDPFGGSEMVPFGRLREPLYALKRADAIIITRANRAFDQGPLLGAIRYCCGDAVPILYFYSAITRLRHLATGAVYDVAEFAGWKASLLCGIGNPEAFAEDVLEAGISVVAEHFYRDHHVYGQADVDSIEQKARTAAADLIITTEKDSVRLEGLKFGEVPVYAAQLEIQSEDEIRLKSLVLRTLHKRREKLDARAGVSG
jgi:tetraacyldisaccharide 4'-kinase